MSKVNIRFKKLYSDAELPVQAYEGDAGFDVFIHSFQPHFMDMKSDLDEYTLERGERVIANLGFALAIPEGWEVQVRPRSGLAIKQGLTILNSPGTIDCGWRGEVGAILVNHGSALKLKKGAKIAQMIVSEVPRVEFEVVDELPESTRGKKGYGSSGV